MSRKFGHKVEVKVDPLAYNVGIIVTGKQIGRAHV